MKIKTMFLCCLMISLYMGTGFARADDKAEPCKDLPPLVVTKVEGKVELGSDIFVTVKNLPAHLKCGKVATKFKLYLDWIKIDQVDAMLVGGMKKSKVEVDLKKAAVKKQDDKAAGAKQATGRKEGEEKPGAESVDDKRKGKQSADQTPAKGKQEGEPAEGALSAEGEQEEEPAEDAVTADGSQEEKPADVAAPVAADKTKDTGILLFKIRHGDSDEAKKAWAALLGRPFSKKERKLETPVIVSVGYDDQAPVAFESKNDKNARLVLVDPLYLGLFIAVMLVVLVLLIWLSISSGILRGPFRDIPVDQRPFSLGRTQMAFWFFLVACSYFFIWLITGNLNTITGSVLALIGISSATYLSSAALSSDKDKQALAARQKLRKDIEALEVTLEELGNLIKKTPTSKAKKELQKQEMEKTIEKRLLEDELRSKTDKLKTNGFFKDLVSDANGVSLNRFQIAVWTGVLGIIFVISVFKSMSMPQFDTTLLALMGISGGTYIGFKIPGGKASEDNKDQKDKPS